MFCIYDTRLKREYFIGDEMFVCFTSSKSFKFRCVLKDILENGQIVLGDIKIHTRCDNYLKMDGTIKTGVYEILCVNLAEKNSRKYSSLALLYKGKSKHNLVSLDGKTVIQENSKIIIKVNSDIGTTTYTGVFLGVSGKGTVNLSDVTAYGTLTITGSDFVTKYDYLSLEMVDGMEIDGIGGVKIG